MDEQKKTIFGFNSKTVFSWGVVLVLVGIGNSYGGALTRLDEVERKVAVLEQINLTEKNNSVELENRVTKLETQYTTILETLKEIKDSLKGLRPITQ